AAHALGGDLTHRPTGLLPSVAELGADLLVAAYAESADRTLGQLLEFLLERVEHRRDRRIGMLRRRPFLIDLLMAFATLRSGGVEGEGFLIDCGDGSFFPLLGFCCCCEFRYLAFGGCFCLLRHLPLPTDRGAFFFGRSCILGESQSGLCLYGWGLPSLAGSSDGILAKECCVTQYGA